VNFLNDGLAQDDFSAFVYETPEAEQSMARPMSRVLVERQ